MANEPRRILEQPALSVGGFTPSTVPASGSYLALDITSDKTYRFQLDELITFIESQGITVDDASYTVKGISERATQSEVNAGTATGGTGAVLFVAPPELVAYVTNYVATNAPVPADATTTVTGIVELATDAEIQSGTDTGGDGPLVVQPSQLKAQIQEQEVQFSSNVITTQEIAFFGAKNIESIHFDITQIDSVSYQTRTGTGSYTSRADLAAVNSVLNANVGIIYLQISATFDASYNGVASALLKVISL